MKKQVNNKGYLAVTDQDKTNFFKESFRGEVVDKTVAFPKELGIEHPFEFEDAENVYKTMGIISGAINKVADNIVGEFQIRSKNAKAKIIIEGFIKDSNLPLHVREWIIESLVKGSGFMEIDLDAQRVRVMNANEMYVVRDKFGEVKGYNQFVGKMKNFSIMSRKLVSFMPNQMCHLMINKISNDAYGQGMLKPNERVIDNLVQNENDLHKLITRKAGAPIHVKVGQPGEVVAPEAVDAIKNLLVYMTNRTEWVTDNNISMEVLSFGEVGKNLTDTLMHDIRMLCAGLEIPEVMFGSGQLNEGIAKVQLEAFQRKIASIQEDIEHIIETNILKPILLSNNLDDDIEFIWNLPGEEEINNRLVQLNTLLANQFLSDGMRQQIQLEIARLLNFNNPESLVNTENTQGQTADKIPDSGSENGDNSGTAERKKEENIPQPEVPGEKNEEYIPMLQEESEGYMPVLSKFVAEDLERNSEEMTLREFVNLQEIDGFNYNDYLLNILRRIKTDKFEDLKAITEADFEKGQLNSDQIEMLRQILKDGFKKNETIVQIEKNIQDNLNLKDRIKEDGGIIPAETRPNLIARTETVRLANIGLVTTYKDNGIEKVRWLASAGDRTCEQCRALDGQVFNIQELDIGSSQPPLHSNCRCSLLSIKE